MDLMDHHLVSFDMDCGLNKDKFDSVTIAAYQSKLPKSEKMGG